ncbi:hypothetical protein L1987_88718 [Smallanthus sonchifolius]|nr:hypothetical protein L1987_88718 [Smallanthus sonchifolius]
MCSRTLHTSVRPELEFVFNRFLSLVEQTSVQDPHPGLIIASLNFKKPYPGVEETELLSLSTLDMLNQYVYPSISGYGRKVLFRLRDSLNLLPGTLNNLAKSLCPSLGSKLTKGRRKADQDKSIDNPSLYG